jgi:methionyl-tRNA formyltransferase
MSKKIVFMGTPDFAVESLKQLIDADVEVAAVVTAPDRPAGRGQQIKESAVKQFAKSQNLTVLQPEKLKAEDFHEQLKTIAADLFVVVAFRMLPEVVWSMPPLGTINLHGSMLPNYTGAAPINWAVINGESETGATTFFIEKEIDTGKIIDHVKIPIGENDTAGKIHDDLMVKGATLLKDTVLQIFEGNVKAVPQEELYNESHQHAPKIFKADCKIDWSKNTEEIHNKIRGLSPYPTAWTEFIINGKKKSIKLFESRKKLDGQNHLGQLKLDESLLIGSTDGWVEILQLQVEGKKRMKATDFISGYNQAEIELA